MNATAPTVAAQISDRIEVRGWRAESLPTILANAWEAAREGRVSSAEYWFADALHVLATARRVDHVDGSSVSL